MYNETSAKNQGENVFVNFGRKSYIQLSHMTFCYSHFCEGNSESKCRLRVQLLLPNSQWPLKFVIDKNTNYGATSKEWTFSQFDFTEKKIVVVKENTTKNFQVSLICVLVKL